MNITEIEERLIEIEQVLSSLQQEKIQLNNKLLRYYSSLSKIQLMTSREITKYIKPDFDENEEIHYTSWGSYPYNAYWSKKWNATWQIREYADEPVVFNIHAYPFTSYGFQMRQDNIKNRIKPIGNTEDDYFYNQSLKSDNSMPKLTFRPVMSVK